MSDYCFYSDEALDLANRYGLKSFIDDFACMKKKQAYILHRPLSKEDATYDYDDCLSVFITGCRPFFLNLGEDDEGFDEYADDYLEDVSFLAAKFEYREGIGRRKKWESMFLRFNKDNMDFDILSDNLSKKDIKTIDLIISLVVGSINDIDRVNVDSEELLDKVKSKIILFDTDQTSFVFNNHLSKKYVIQGLAGSGKTELLLHKLKEIYSKNADARIAFTCYNKILAADMKKRIPDFFDFMRVERQIDWDNKLFCFHSWGYKDEYKSGMYRYITSFYKLPYGNLYSGTFDELCDKLVKEIKENNLQENKIFDYVFVDESQDFSESFIELCDLVTSKRVYVAGDVFQNIFRPISDDVNVADKVLKKCYRTDPKNLMFSHALGMGLYEEKVLRWLKESEWDACGYNYREDNGKVLLSRDPLRRFEDIPEDYQSTYIHELSDESISQSIVKIINRIKIQNVTIHPEDIAIIFVDSEKYIYNLALRVEFEINNNLGWGCNIAYKTKERRDNEVFISNVNNAKGLEFPFVICVATELKDNPSFRNGLYTMMARSFLESHLILRSSVGIKSLPMIKKGLDFLTEHNEIKIKKPNPDDVADLKDYIIEEESISIQSMVDDFCKERRASPRLTAKVKDHVFKLLANDDVTDQKYVTSIIEAAYIRYKDL